MAHFELDPKNLPQLSQEEKKRVHSLKDEEIQAAALSDPDAQPLEADDFEKMKPILNSKRIRQELGMSQAVFAKAYHLKLRTLQDWEQNRCSPDASTQTLLRLIQKFPEQVKKMLEMA